LGPVRGRDCRNVDDGHIHVSERPPRGQLRLRQRRRGRAVPHLARRRTRLPALRVEPRHGGCPHGRRRKEEAMTTTATAIRAVRRRRGTTHTAGPWVYLMATILVAICIGPVLYIIIGGFRTNSQITQDPSGWPAPWVFSNYGDVLVSSEFWLAMGNSTISAGVTTLGTVVLGVMASYVIARYDFLGKGAMYSLFAAGLMFPATVAITPLYLLIRNLGLVNSLAGVILPQIAFALPTTIIILVPFLRAIPKELEEAASIDGTGRLGFFWRMVIPLS